ncbi:MAG: hypothetical protein RQ714_09530, partial [Nitrosomonas sp.]|nr:hypothetical protein [Nitrosomonas sp.]
STRRTRPQRKETTTPGYSAVRKQSSQSKRDPIFTQPYIPSETVVLEQAKSMEAGKDGKSILPYRKQQDAESLPVLFKVPVKGKENKD